MGMIGRDEINRRLGFHPATAETIPLFEDNRARAVELAAHWDETLPPGREAALAQTALQEAVMWANAAVACSAPLEDPAGRRPNPLTQVLAEHPAARLCGDSTGFVSGRRRACVLLAGHDGDHNDGAVPWAAQ
jgi:hypothetical protein